MKQSRMRTEFTEGRVSSNWITFPVLVLVCFCMFLCNPIGLHAEVGAVVETWDISNIDADTNPGIINGTFSEYNGMMSDLDPDTGAEVKVPVEGLALTLTVPNGDYVITPMMMEEISNKASTYNKKIYSMTIVGEEGAQAQILVLDGYTDSSEYNGFYLNNPDNDPDSTQFALIEVDFQVPIVEMNSLFSGNKTLEIVHHLTFSDQTPNMNSTFYETPKLRQIPDPFVIPENVKELSFTFAYTGLEKLSNLTIKNADTLGEILEGAKTKIIENWTINGYDTNWIFSGSKIEQMNNIYIKGYRIDFHSPETLTSVAGLTLDMVADNDGNAYANELFKGCSNLTEAEVTLNVDANVKYLAMGSVFQGTGLLSTPKNFKIPESIENASLEKMFACCPNLSSISEDFTIPQSVLNNSSMSRLSNMFIGCPKLSNIPVNFVASLGVFQFAGCNALTTLPDGFRIGNIDRIDDYKMEQWGYYSPMFGKVDYPENGSFDEYYVMGNTKKATIALPLQVDESLKKYQELGEVNFTQKLFFEGLPQGIQIDALDMLVGATYSDEINGLKTQLETIKNNLELKGYTDISFILKPYVESNPIVENYAKFRSLFTRNAGALDSGKTFDDFIAELGTQTMDCDPKVIEVKYSEGVGASKPNLTATPVYTDTKAPYDQTEWTKDNITVNIVAKDSANGIDKIVITEPNGNKVDVPNTTQGNEFTYGHQIAVTDITTSGEYTYKYQTVNTQGTPSDEISVTIKVDVDKPQASIKNGKLTATDGHSGVKEIKLPNGIIVTWTNDCVNNGYEVSEYGYYEIYDKVGNVTVIEYKQGDTSKPNLTATPVYTGTDTPYAQIEWTKDNITVNIVAKDSVNGIDKIVITDPNGTKHDVPNTTQGNEFAYGHQIPVTDITTSGEYTYKYQTVNKQGTPSDEISVIIRVDIDKPQASIENGILKATDGHSGVKEIKLPDGTIISWIDDYGNNGYEVSEYGTYEIYDNAGNVTEVIYKATAVTEPAITLAYEKEWTNKDVMVEVTITNADEVALLEFPDGTTRVLGDENTFTTSYLVQEEGEKDYRFAITKKAKAEGNLVETAHIKLDKTAPTSSIVTVNGKNYLKASDALSGVSHLISPSGKTIMWLPEYEQNGYPIAEDGTYQVYDRAGNNGEQYGTQIKEEVTPIAPIPTIPSFPEENKIEPETDKKTEDKKEPETDKKTEDKKEPETDKKTEDKKEPETDKKTEDKKESKPDKKTEDKKETKPDKKTEDKTTDKQSKEDGTLEYSKTPETPTDVEIKLLTPDGKIETIYIPKGKVYLLESGETIFGRDIGYPFIDRIYYGGKGRPIIVGLNGEEYQCLKITPVSETVMSDSKHGTLVGTSNVTSPKTGDNIIQVVLLFMFSGVFVAGVFIRNRRKTMK